MNYSLYRCMRLDRFTILLWQLSKRRITARLGGGLVLFHRLQRLGISLFSEKKENTFTVSGGRESVRLGVWSVKSMLSVSMSHR